MALVALGVLVLAGTSDFVIGGFWSGHPMLTAILSALVVILLSAAVIDVILRRRDEKVRNDPSGAAPEKTIRTLDIS
jgi:predicted branched-subunit amino acid permease